MIKLLYEVGRWFLFCCFCAGTISLFISLYPSPQRVPKDIDDLIDQEELIERKRKKYYTNDHPFMKYRVPKNERSIPD